jgi:rieske iron-sulfur protein
MAAYNDKLAPRENPHAKQGSTRRAVLEPVVALALSAPMRCMAQASAKPEKQRPQPGDRLVFAFGPREGEPLQIDELTVDEKPVTAWPMSPDTGVVRSGSRLNRVMVMRLDLATLSAKTAKGAADGIVAYSAVCPHTGCDVEGWNEETHRLVCPCHESEFEVADGARVMTGPAPKPLAMLPLEIAEGELRVARGFTRRVGFQPN